LTPKGSDTLARGNAPGRVHWNLQPDGLRYALLSQAFSLEDNYDHVPRAMPWAKVSDPFGVKP
jgi:hypothetical protein